MNSNKKIRFKRDIARGRAFEQTEKEGWRGLDFSRIKYEASTCWKKRAGRIDIRIDEYGGFVSIVEIKATNWEMMMPHRIRPNVLRHARQVLRYIYKEVLTDGLQVCAGIIYEYAPSNVRTKHEVEDILFERGIQVVWRR